MAAETLRDLAVLLEFKSQWLLNLVCGGESSVATILEFIGFLPCIRCNTTIDVLLKNKIIVAYWHRIASWNFVVINGSSIGVTLNKLVTCSLSNQHLNQYWLFINNTPKRCFNINTTFPPKNDICKCQQFCSHPNLFNFTLSQAAINHHNNFWNVPIIFTECLLLWSLRIPGN